MKNNIEKSSKLGNKNGKIRPFISHCIQCEREFVTPKPHGRISKYCSRKCYMVSYIEERKRKDSEKHCVICGRKLNLHQVGGKGKCCSIECASKKHGKLLKETERVIATCADCGKSYETHKLFGRNNKYVFRCPGCRLVHDRNRCRKRRMKISQFKPGVNDFEIFERDHWICQICGESVDQNRRWPDSLSASIDHIKPISSGGLHIPSNVRLTHHSCNNQKHMKYREGYRYETWTCT